MTFVKAPKPSLNEKKMAPLGWAIIHTDPLHQSFHFEQRVSGHRMGAAIVVAKTRPRAWTQLKRMCDKEQRRRAKR